MTNPDLPDANYRFPPLVRPAENADTTMAKLDAQADLLMALCPHCRPTMEVADLVPTSVLPRAIGITHESTCPEWIPDRP